MEWRRVERWRADWRPGGKRSLLLARFFTQIFSLAVSGDQEWPDHERASIPLAIHRPISRCVERCVFDALSLTRPCLEVWKVFFHAPLMLLLQCVLSLLVVSSCVHHNALLVFKISFLLQISRPRRSPARTSIGFFYK
ncbi:uncharacterized protein LOC112348928 [Selaginella moellendorffii]|uniref:uncharacterized protein LOC112348928 n=1 Tax=Selaginella moellendorffii TaxID=88036 RepID=UPI000D1CA340|nr:uncharacterized protein LOC112348928 [Selaginella moellendorffii]|eukprot:XP_024538088.1 uncharacterized protein LOC112348928 [Selaginella moellendorffii]